MKNAIIEVRAKPTVLDEALPVAQRAFDVKQFEVYRDTKTVVLDLLVMPHRLEHEEVDDFTGQLREFGPAMVVYERLTDEGETFTRIAYGTRQGPRAL